MIDAFLTILNFFFIGKYGRVKLKQQIVGVLKKWSDIPMNYFVEKRKVTINADMFTKIENIKDYLGIDKSTIVSMAVYHGIQNMQSGYVPKESLRIAKEEKRKKMEIGLPKEIWKDFDKYCKALKIPMWELVEILLKVEYIKYRDIIEKLKGCNSGHLSSDNEKISIYTNVPRPIYNKIIEKEQKLNLAYTQYIKYLFLNAVIEEEKNSLCDAIYFDADTIEIVERLKMNRETASSFAAFIIKYKCQNGEYKE